MIVLTLTSKETTILRMPIDPTLFEALHLVQVNPAAQRIFTTVSDKLGVSGWELAKIVNQNPDETDQLLREFTDKGIFRTPSPGLDGNYSLTGLGFTLKEQLSAGRFSR